ncbi:RNA-binding domain-containing protein, partial [Ramicandelaber brevisporus]
DEDDAELEAMRQKVKEMEEEAVRLKQLQEQTQNEYKNAATAAASKAAKNESTKNETNIDTRSVYVSNVDYSTEPEELQAHFGGCGVINRITIPKDFHTKQPRGFAYIEFADLAGVENALVLNESMFKDRVLGVVKKRTNV